MSEDDTLALENLMRTVEGRGLLWRWLQRAGTLRDTFDPDPVTHAFNAGARSVGLMMDRDMRETGKDQYILMVREND